MITMEPNGSPEKSTASLMDSHEPRTIALIYRKGRPLWPEWPVIPDEEPLLAKDIVRVLSVFSEDKDIIKQECATSGDCESLWQLTRTITTGLSKAI